MDANCGHNFFIELGLGIKVLRVEELETIFANEVNYFPHKGKVQSNYQFSPYVTSFGLSLLFKLRVVLINANDIKNKETGEYHQKYKTFVYDSREHEGNGWYMGKVVRFDGVYKIPDDELDASRTVELVYINFGTHGHFLYMKRNKKMSRASIDKYKALVAEEVLCDPSETAASTNTAGAAGDNSGEPEGKNDKKDNKSLITQILSRKNESEFGRLALQDLKKLRFYSKSFAKDNKHLKEVNKHYEIVDVVSDGNCGPYVHLIAWMDICETEDELFDIFTKLTGGDEVYQEMVKSYWQKLRQVFSAEFINANCCREFFVLLGMSNEALRGLELKAIFDDGVNYFP